MLFTSLKSVSDIQINRCYCFYTGVCLCGMVSVRSDSAPDNLTLCACWGFLSVAPVVALPFAVWWADSFTSHAREIYREGLCALRWGLLFFVFSSFLLYDCIYNSEVFRIAEKFRQFSAEKSGFFLADFSGLFDNECW
jgi:hypothetical protein